MQKDELNSGIECLFIERHNVYVNQLCEMYIFTHPEAENEKQ